PVFQKRLAKLADHPLVGEAMGVGLIGAVELVANKKTKQNFEPAKQAGVTLMNFAQDEGLIVRALLGDRIALCPPLVITEAEINDSFHRLERGLAKSLDWATREKLIAA